MTPDMDNIKESLNTMEENIETLKIVIKDLKYRLDGALRIFKRYHYIAKDIVGKFELFNQDLKNHRILRSLWNLQNSNKIMNDELTKIIQEEDAIKKVNQAIAFYEKKEENKVNKNKILDDINQNTNEIDDWWEEIQKQSKKKGKNEKNEENGNSKIDVNQIKKSKIKNPKK